MLRNLKLFDCTWDFYTMVKRDQSIKRNRVKRVRPIHAAQTHHLAPFSLFSPIN